MRVPTAFQRPILGLFLCLVALPPLSGCSLFHRKPGSYNRIIEEGDPNPTFRADPVRAGEVIRRANEPRRSGQEFGRPQTYPQDLQPQ